MSEIAKAPPTLDFWLTRTENSIQENIQRRQSECPAAHHPMAHGPCREKLALQLRHGIGIWH